MNYIINFFSIFTGTNQLLMSYDRNNYLLVFFSGVALASILWVLCAYFGRLFYKPYRLSIGQHILCGLLAVMVVLTLPTYVSSVYIQPTLIEMIKHWRDTLVNNKAWNDQQFKHEYYEIKKMGVEDFSSSPSPEQPDATTIPLHHLESRLKVGQMSADAAIKNFDFNFPLISKVIGAKPNISANTVSQDITNYFNTNPSSFYPHNRSIELAVVQIYKELEPQVPRVIFIIRLLLVLLVFLSYAICLGWIAYAALRQIRTYSAHT